MYTQHSQPGRKLHIRNPNHVNVKSARGTPSSRSTMLDKVQDLQVLEATQ